MFPPTRNLSKFMASRFFYILLLIHLASAKFGPGARRERGGRETARRFVAFSSSSFSLFLSLFIAGDLLPLSLLFSFLPSLFPSDPLFVFRNIFQTAAAAAEGTQQKAPTNERRTEERFFALGEKNTSFVRYVRSSSKTNSFSAQYFPQRRRRRRPQKICGQPEITRSPLAVSPFLLLLIPPFLRRGKERRDTCSPHGREEKKQRAPFSYISWVGKA